MPFKCKDKCSNYKDVLHKKYSYESGLIAFCSPCQKLLLVKDTVKHRCFCCNSKTRSSPKSRTIAKSEHVRYE
jgi:hypothetical protein